MCTQKRDGTCAGQMWLLLLWLHGCGQWSRFKTSSSNRRKYKWVPLWADKLYDDFKFKRWLKALDLPHCCGAAQTTDQHGVSFTNTGSRYWFLSMAIQIAYAPPKHKTCSRFTNLVSVHQTQDSTTNSSSLILALPLQMYGQNTSSLLSRMCLETGSGRVRSCSALDQTSGLELCTGCGWKRRPMPGSLPASANQILAHFKTLWVAGIPSSRVYFSLLYNCGSQN